MRTVSKAVKSKNLSKSMGHSTIHPEKQNIIRPEIHENETHHNLTEKQRNIRIQQQNNLLKQKNDWDIKKFDKKFSAFKSDNIYLTAVSFFTLPYISHSSDKKKQSPFTFMGFVNIAKTLSTQTSIFHTGVKFTGITTFVAQRSFSTQHKPKTKHITAEVPRDISEFEYIDEIPDENKGRYPVFKAKCKITEKPYIIKCLSYFTKDFICARESGSVFNIENILLDTAKVRLKQQMEVFSTRYLKLATNENHVPKSIFPVVKKEDGILLHYIASEEIPGYSDIRDKKFSTRNGRTIILPEGDETFGRISLKIALSLIERDGNKQNFGRGAKQNDGRVPIVSIDHGECFNLRFELDKNTGKTNIITQIIENGRYVEKVADIETFIAEKVKMLVDGPIYSSFGDVMQLHHEEIKEREAVRYKSVAHKKNIFAEEIALRELFCKTFTNDHPKDQRKQIADIAKFLNVMREIYSQAYYILEERHKTLQGPDSQTVTKKIKESFLTKEVSWSHSHSPSPDEPRRSRA